MKLIGTRNCVLYVHTSIRPYICFGCEKGNWNIILLSLRALIIVLMSIGAKRVSLSKLANTNKAGDAIHYYITLGKSIHDRCSAGARVPQL